MKLFQTIIYDRDNEIVVNHKYKHEEEFKETSKKIKKVKKHIYRHKKDEEKKLEEVDEYRRKRYEVKEYSKMSKA